MASILVLGAKVPFTSGGQEVLMASLVRELKARGHTVDTVELPFLIRSRADLLEQAALWRSLDLSQYSDQPIDLVIATKFPSYYARHPRKSLWLVHQHRPLYDLYAGPYSDFSDDPRDEAIRRMLVRGDNQAISECAFVSGISKNVVTRLAHYNGIRGQPLYPPLPLGGRYRQAPSEDYILSVGRICGIKRVDLMVKALPMVHQFMKFKIVGQPDEPGIMDYLRNECTKHHLWHRVEFLGRVDDETLLDLYSKARAVYYAPHNEDYGYVTLEAMASGKPVVTATDSGGTLEFVTDKHTGIITEPTLDGISRGFNTLIENPELAANIGAQGRKLIDELGISASDWDRVTASLLSPLTATQTATQEAACSLR
ncbi:MAG: glycosyltransferase [Proteobacteria bacterium]|nr:glycosyltransferase [Pseudomonadota bacterium]